MKLFDKLFKRKPSPEMTDENLPAFWEDDYCQIEIVPRKNIDHIRHSIKKIDEFTENTSTEFGFTDIFMRESLPFPTLNEELRIDYFEILLTERGFNKAKQIRYDGHILIDCVKNTSNAYSLRCFNFFYDCKIEFINNVWISTSLSTSTENLNNIIEILYELGESCKLVLIDWNISELVDLADRRQIENYLMSTLK